MTAKREFFSTNEIAQILGVSPFTIRRYIQLRKIKAVKLEGSYRVRRAALDDFIRAREVEAEEELDPLEESPEEEVEIPAASPRAKTVTAQVPLPVRSPRRPTRKPKSKPRVAKRVKEEKE